MQFPRLIILPDDYHLLIVLVDHDCDCSYCEDFGGYDDYSQYYLSHHHIDDGLSHYGNDVYGYQSLQCDELIHYWNEDVHGDDVCNLNHYGDNVHHGDCAHHGDCNGLSASVLPLCNRLKKRENNFNGIFIFIILAYQNDNLLHQLAWMTGA